jgi:hypothetical protein
MHAVHARGGQEYYEGTEYTTMMLRCEVRCAKGFYLLCLGQICLPVQKTGPLHCSNNLLMESLHKIVTARCLWCTLPPL